jgi:hypothetical protein
VLRHSLLISIISSYQEFMKTIIHRSLAAFTMSALVLSSFALSFGAVAPLAQASTNWNATGTYVIDMVFQGTHNPHDMILAQNGSGNLTGSGGSPAGANTFKWVIDSGSVSGNTIAFTAHYTATADASTTVLMVTGTINPGGSMSGSWSDNYPGPANAATTRTGTWTTTSGNATAIAPIGPVFIDANTNGTLDSGEQSFTTIQAALNAASSGQTVIVGPGTYNESPNLTKSVILKSAGGKDVTTIVLQSGPTYTGALTVAASGVTVSGFTIQGFDASGSGLASTNIYLTSGVSNVTVSNNNIEVGQIGSGANGDDGIGLLTYYTITSIGDNISVTNNTFEPVDSAGGFRAFYINPGINHFTFSGNTITGNFTKTSITQAQDGLVQNNTVTGVGAADSRSAGLGTWGYPDATVWGHTTFSGNTVSGTTRAIAVYETNNVSISGNTLSGNGTGVWVGNNYPIPFDVTTVSANKNDVSSEDTFGVDNESATTTAVNASCNWWGAANGPGSVGAGSGSHVTANVTASTWLTSSDLTSTCNGPLPPTFVTTKAATATTSTSATINGTNGDTAADYTSFWWGTTSISNPSSSTSPTLPSGWSHADFPGTQTAGASFSDPLTGLTPNTPYYFVAWVRIGGIWYPGNVLSFNTGTVTSATPTVSSLSPNTGTIAGGDTVTITGTGFTGATSVTFGGMATTSFSVTGGGTSITVTSPATTTTGVVNVTVTTPGGTSAVSAGDQFTYKLVGTVTGAGVLHVDSIVATKASATSDGTFASGWIYTFNITVPTGETNLAMKFADWLSGTNVLPVANNMRIFSPQSSNATNEASAILLTAANAYSSPLHITGDLSPSTQGLQVAVTVEVAIPIGTADGSYTTTYGVQTLPL